MTPDNELLRRFAQFRSEDAIAELVRRYVNLVYSAALRQVGGDAHLAQDVAQTVFTDLIRKASSLSRRESLTGWFYSATHFAAGKMVRTETRRREREERFMREPIHDTAPDADWEKLRPILDAAMHGLKETDREAVLLRYFENRPYAEVGAKLGINENAARMRVERALEKLRVLLTERGVATGTALASAISANAVQVAPGYLAATLTNASLASAATALPFMKIITSAKLQLGLGALLAAGVIAAFVVQHQTQSRLRANNDALSEQLAQLKSDNANLSNQVYAADNSQLSANGPQLELLKLRAEVTRLRAMKAPSPTAAAIVETNNTLDPTNIEITVKTRFVTAPAGEMPASSAAWAPAGSGARLLSQGQFASILKTLKENQVLHLIGESQVTTRNGGSANASMFKAVSVNGTNAQVGEFLGLTPYFSLDSSTFTLNFMAQLNQLTGDPSQPTLQTIQTPTNHVNLFPDQTLVLQQDIPAGGWLLDETNTSEGPRTLLVFVTPTLIDASGNRSPTVSQDTAMQKLTDAKQGVQALLMFAWDNQNQFPTNLAQVSDYLKDGSMEQIAANFDMLYSGPIFGLTNPATTIELSEKHAWVSPAGTWMKSYGFADGHSELHTEPNGDFADYEKSHTISRSANQ
jgi:RNA polymerase sigma factor (sigma-70 family)